MGGRGASSASAKGGASAALQEEAVDWYVSGDGMWVNNHLRGVNDVGELSPQELQLIKGLDAATDSALGKEMTLYRSVDAAAVFGNMSAIEYENLQGAVVYGASDKFSAGALAKAQAAIGKTITEKGFMSTTKSAELAHDWGGFTGSEKPIVLKLTTKKGTKGKDLTSHFMQQDEILLKRGQKWRPTGITAEGGSIVVLGEFV